MKKAVNDSVYNRDCCPLAESCQPKRCLLMLIARGDSLTLIPHTLLGN